MDLQVQVTRVIAGRVMEEFPDLKLIFSHFGGGIAAVKERLAAKSGRFGTLKRPFEESFDRLYFDTAGFEGGPIALRCAVAGIRPTGWFSRPIIRRISPGATTQSGKTVPRHSRSTSTRFAGSIFRPAAADAILGGTAAKLLHLERGAVAA